MPEHPKSIVSEHCARAIAGEIHVTISAPSLSVSGQMLTTLIAEKPKKEASSGPIRQWIFAGRSITAT
jgi:hypothetical protein